ncbi:putative Vacuolar protein-sorting-associated protein 25 [Blattamonas nauphoetae]|uniref:Vacuolar protein-sorting-associated protein 25 n=1 Tax=Blattamonas nauphoetae TaxID=2049346 RepID=A0ABQ9XKQ5_9EUKA|nr:putative Vacuolar protein-sorting-associated protein 25 [Blattamonas nauphoetae]
MAQTFEYPSFYHLPPFYTLQEVIATKQKQIGLWQEFTIRYCKANKIQRISVNDCDKIPIFHNDTIQRKLSPIFIREILDSLAKIGNAKWLDETKTTAIITWRTIPDWANFLSQYVTDKQMKNTPHTLNDFLNREISADPGFVGMDQSLFLEVLQYMKGKGTCVLMEGPEGKLMGFKFV